MASLLNTISGNNQRARWGTDALWVDDIEYTNSAAKFWSCLIDEVKDNFPHCRMELSAPSSEPLVRQHLHPGTNVNWDALITMDSRKVMRESIADLSLLGPPSPVQIHILDGEADVFAAALPIDCIDADILSCLLAWLLEWAHIPQAIWNQPLIDGTINAIDKYRRLNYDISFKLAYQHIYEGLYQRRIALTSSVSTANTYSTTQQEEDLS